MSNRTESLKWSKSPQPMPHTSISPHPHPPSSSLLFTFQDSSSSSLSPLCACNSDETHRYCLYTCNAFLFHCLPIHHQQQQQHHITLFFFTPSQNSHLFSNLPIPFLFPFTLRFVPLSNSPHPPFPSASDADSGSSLFLGFSSFSLSEFSGAFFLMDFASSFNFLTEFGCGYVLLGCFSKLLNYLGMFLMFGFCFKVLRFGWHSKGLIRFLCDFGGIPRIRLCLENGFWQVSESKVAPLEKGSDDPLKSSSAQNVNSPIKKSSSVAREKGNANSEEGLEGKDENEREVVDEDEVFDVMALRKLVKIERQKANAACAELEKERTAAGSSAEEAMAMILRLQNEKSSVEIQANQFRRMAEQKLDYDQEVIESLQWTITQQESQRSLLEEQIGIYREELKQFLSDDEINQLQFDISSDGSVVSSSETESQTTL